MSAWLCDRLLTQIANETSRVRPMEALGIAADLPDSPAHDDLIRHAALQWAAVAPMMPPHGPAI